MRFVVIEGLDGSGKSTQIRMLRKYLEEQKIQFKYLHFPRTEAPVYGDLISRYLRGELGKINSLNPYLAALLYAGDRNDAKGLINDWQEKGYFILLDRYVNSNIAFQCAKMKSESERRKLEEWIINLEYNHNQLRVPDLSIFLDVPFEFTRQQLLTQREGEDRMYLHGKKDIHEADLDFQNMVRKVYLDLEGKIDNYKVLHCYEGGSKILKPQEIFQRIVDLIF